MKKIKSSKRSNTVTQNLRMIPLTARAQRTVDAIVGGVRLSSAGKVKAFKTIIEA